MPTTTSMTTTPPADVILETRAGPLRLTRLMALRLAVSYADSGDLDTANDVCDRILASSRGDKDALLLKLWIATRQGNETAAGDLASRLAREAVPSGPAPRFAERFCEPVLHDPELRAAFGPSGLSVSDMSDHVIRLFETSVSALPRLIVELGTRDGQSTRALAAAARRSGGQLLSIDIAACETVGMPDELKAHWTFVQADDVAFGSEGFTPWCAARRLDPMIDVLFIDTSHEYVHTRRELELWLPRVRSGGVAMFHDTNLDYTYLRNDLSVGRGWNNQRGVIRALEEHFGRRWDETRYFIDCAGAWLITHDPKSNGFTTLRRLAASAGLP